MSDYYRIEKDLLGEMEIPADSLAGIHTYRGASNFPYTGRAVPQKLYQAYGAVKLAALSVIEELGVEGEEEKFEKLIQAAVELAEGNLTVEPLLDMMQGGAGTSINMAVNEAIANRALLLSGKEAGDYAVISVLNDVNRYQSTNDTFPTAVRVCVIRLFQELETKVVALQESFQEKEKEFADVVKCGRTEMQDAVLTTLGREMGAYGEAFGRDRWRIFKCVERLRTVNLGGTAIGSGIAAERNYIFRVTEKLRELTGIGFARAENPVEATQNLDPFVEVSGILKSCASSLIKVANDLRLLSSGPDAGFGEITLPAVQAGSSIMPGKVNPVICESVVQAGMQVMANDSLIAMAVASGSLELNPFLPLIAHALIDSLELLITATTIFAEKCVSGITANRERLRATIENSEALLTALVATLGYERCSDIALKAREEAVSLREIVINDAHMSEEEFDYLISPEAVCALGFRKRKRK